jgi:hypothetical protein
MILFYSTFCNHCNMLLENIKRYDKEKKIKLVSMDELLTKNINIQTKIHSVPAFMLLPSKEILFGKDVFDHLLLPGRGILCGGQNTRMDKPSLNINSGVGGSGGSGDENIKPLENQEADGDPSAFTLNGFKFSDKYSTIEDEGATFKDKNYNWDYITNDTNYSDSIGKIPDSTNESKKSNMPTLEEIQKERDSFKY